MSNTKEMQTPPVLDDEILGLLGAASAAGMPAHRKSALFSRIMARIDSDHSSDDPPSQRSAFVTVRADEGAWIALTPKIEKKVLFVDRERNVEACLLRVQPGAQAPPHLHQADEYCLVLEGDVSYDDIHLKAGDFHFARSGSWHGTARSEGGALVYLESAV